MNKILVEEVMVIDELEGIIDTKNNTLKLDILNNNKIYFYKNNLNDLELNLFPNSNLDIYLYNINNDDLTIKINQNNNSKINLCYSFVNEFDNYLKIISNVKSDNNITNIFVKNISKRGLSKIDVTAIIDNNTKNNLVLEKVNVITLDGNAVVKPDILCSSFEIEANHENTIGAIDKEQLHYLMQKGLSLQNAKKLICKGFILDNMEEYMKEIINNEGGVNFE